MYKRLRLACYTSSCSMSVVGNLPPLLFLTFRAQYGLSFSLLGTLVAVNYVTQLAIDLVFSFFSHRFNIFKTLKLMPVLTLLGLLCYAAAPVVLPQAVYAGLLVGTVLFSAAAGLAEVLISPVIAAIPADDPDREMSKLHSIYAWGTVFVVIVSTLFLLAFGTASWQWLTLLFALLPLSSAILFRRAKFPAMETPKQNSAALALFKKPALWLSFAAIFLGGASECTMAQWASGYLEQALGIDKVWGDVFGVALFAVMLGTGRTLYASRGRNLGTVLLAGGIGATLCYLVAAITSAPVVGLIACALTGLCTSLLWPGNLVAATDRFPTGGVFLYALMAAGGDLGASVGPQMIGMITDAVIAQPQMLTLAESLSLAPEQLGMKLGMLAAMGFPLISIPVYAAIRRYRRLNGLEGK